MGRNGGNGQGMWRPPRDFNGGKLLQVGRTEGEAGATEARGKWAVEEGLLLQEKLQSQRKQPLPEGRFQVRGTGKKQPGQLSLLSHSSPTGTSAG